MALTDEGRALTESHRLAQIAIAARAESLGRILWPRLQVSNLDDPAWLGANVEAARRFFNQSVSLASEYVSEYRGVELGSDAGPIVGPEFDTATQRQALLLAGPVRVKMLVGGGMTGTAARAAARAKYGGILRRQVLSGGRMMINETTAADTRAIGWRRVSDGNPCAFCAMLVTRGPVYSSSGKAVATGGEGLRYHGSCGCTAEIVYGEWKPSEREQEFIDAYEKAAAEANKAGFSRTQDSVLPRMRGNGIFRDSPLTRNK